MVLLVPLVIKAATIINIATTVKNVYDTGKNIYDAIEINEEAETEHSKAKKNLDEATEEYKRIMTALLKLRDRVCEDLFGIDRNWRGDSLVSEIQGYVKREIKKVFDEFNVAQEHKTSIISPFEIATTGVLGTAAVSLVPKFVKLTLEEIAIKIGTTSTGKAISTLTGVAQQKAIYTWLGGGAKTTGGLGVDGGKSLASGLNITSVFSTATTVTSIISSQVLCKVKESAYNLNVETKSLIVKAGLVRIEHAGKLKAYGHLQDYLNKANLLILSNPERAKRILIGVLHHLGFIILFDHFSFYGENFTERINQIIQNIMRDLAQ